MHRKQNTLFFVVLALMATAFGIIAQESGNGTTVIGGDDAALRRFIERELGGLPGAPYVVNQTITVGELPQTLLMNVPIPEGATIIGSVSQNEPEAYTRLSFDTTLTNAELTAFYQTAFADAAVWRDVTDDAGQPTGFGASDILNANYCYNGNEGFVNVNGTANPAGGNTSVIVFMRQPGDAYLCGDAQEVPPYSDPYRLLPSLSNPEGATLSSIGNGSGGFPGEQIASTLATVSTTLSAAELTAFYNAQLAVTGWVQVSAGGDTNIGYSTWSFTDDQGNSWNGTLTIVAVPTSAGSFYATVQIAEV
ncbi:MAG: hypothetical protein ACOYL5_00070 [Phototrophicaceae bacterium]